MRKRFWKGLRTIEIVIPLLIICIIVVVVTTRYNNFKCRAMQSEAKFSLQEIYAAQKYYHTQFDHYATVDTLLLEDNRAIVPNRYYIFSDRYKPGKDSFSIVAEGVKGSLVAGEQWTINQNKEMVLTKTVCTDIK